MVWSPGHGDSAFTVPLFDQFMYRIMQTTDGSESWSRGGRPWLPLPVVLRIRTRDDPLLGCPCLADARLLLYLDLSSWNPRVVNVLLNSLLHATPLRDADVVGRVPFRLDPIDDRLVVRKLGGTVCVERDCLCCHLFVSSDHWHMLKGMGDVVFKGFQCPER